MDKKTIADMTINIGAKSDKLKRELADAKKHTKGFKDDLKDLGRTIGSVFAVGALVQFGKSAVEVAAKAEGIGRAFDKLNQPGLLDDLRRATRGTIDDITLMQKAVQAKNFKIPLDQLATYFKFATNRAIETGESVDYLVNSIITGIGRKSVLVMDNLGISAAELQEEVKKVGDFGAAAGVIIQRELAAAGDVADSTTTKFERMNATWTNAKMDLGTWMIENSGLLRGYDRFQQISESNLSTWRKLKLAFGESKKELAEFEKVFNSLMQAEKDKANSDASVRAFESAMFGNKNTVTTESVEANPESINDYKKLLEQKTEARDAASEAEVAALNREIEAIQEKINKLKELGLEEDEQVNKSLPGMTKASLNYSLAADSAAESVFNLKESMSQLNSSIRMGVEDTKKAMVNMTDFMKGQMTDAIVGIAQSLGKAFSGGLGGAEDQIKEIAKFMQTIGTLFVAYGMAAKEFKDALLDPNALIIAGAALVAIGAAISAAHASRPGSSGSSSGGASAAVSRQVLELKGEFTLKGRDLQLALNRNNYNMQRG